jgi:SAM-dependent methyltransferase
MAVKGRLLGRLRRLLRGADREQAGLTREHVVWGYRLFLDREPESDLVVDGKLRTLRTVQELRRELLASAEYEAKNAVAQPLRVPLAREQLRLPERPVGPPRLARRLCKLCDEADWHGDDWLGFAVALLGPEHTTHKHRKAWEWAQGLYALEGLGLLNDRAVGLDVGAGVEGVLFYLTNRVKMLHATDIYGQGEFAHESAPAGMLDAPETFAPFPFREKHLAVRRMDGRRLEFPDDLFDFVVSFSSIEHFGGHHAAAESMREIARVLRPGGAAVLVTELVLNGVAHPEFFRPEELDTHVVQASGLRLIEEIDYSLTDSTLANALDRDHPDAPGARPHVILRQGGVYWTSVCVVLEKPR